MTIRVVLFDLDDTLYPAASGVMHMIDRRIGEFVQQSLGLSEDESLSLRRRYYAEYGTTLRGLRHNHAQVDTEGYLEYVHDLALDAFLVSDERLDLALAGLNARKAIFTNSPREHAERVLRTLGIEHHFERIFDVRFFDFVCKPDLSCYRRVLEEMDITGHEAIMIEDMPKNLPPAAQLGMTTILVADAAPDPPIADFVVADVIAAVDVARGLVDLKPSRAKSGAKNGRRHTQAGASLTGAATKGRRSRA